MTTITQKKKLSKGTWVLIFVVIAAVITVAVLAAVGYISLAFLGNFIIGVCTFGTTGWVNGTLVLGASFVLGVFACYVMYRYFIGQKVTTTMPAYAPAGQTLSQPAQTGSETVIT